MPAIIQAMRWRKTGFDPRSDLDKGVGFGTGGVRFKA